MNNFAKIGLLVLVGAALVLVGCGSDSTTNVDDNGVVVGDVLTGGFVVTVDDNAGGYIATRAFDGDDDGAMDGADDEYQAFIIGEFSQDITLDRTVFDADGRPAADADNVAFYLGGAVYIGDNEGLDITLTIPAGTLIKGEVSSTNPGLLVITRGAKIDAQGTADDPIVMTSAREAGSRAPGDWGGLVINGYAPIQGGTAEGEGSTGTYGGDDAADDSGVLEYVVLQFAGTLFTPDNELNGIAFQGVGSGTEVDYIQIHKNADDGVEFFGGSVAAKHLVLTGIQDDGLDYDDGWTGSAQFVVIHQYGDGGNAIEADGDAEDGIAPADPILANFTIIGATGDNGPNFKSAAEGELWNSIIVNYPAGTVALAEATDDQPTVAYAGVGISSVDAISGAADWAVAVGSDGNVYDATEANIVTGLDYSITAPDYVPATLGGATAQTLPTADKAGNAITAAAYLGAINVGGTDWTSGWTSFPEN